MDFLNSASYCCLFYSSVFCFISFFASYSRFMCTGPWSWQFLVEWAMSFTYASMYMYVREALYMYLWSILNRFYSHWRSTTSRRLHLESRFFVQVLSGQTMPSTPSDSVNWYMDSLRRVKRWLHWLATAKHCIGQIQCFALKIVSI